MIDRFLGDAFWVFSCQFWSTVQQCGARLPIHTFFLTASLSECEVSHRRSVAVFCVMYKMRCNAMHNLYGALLWVCASAVTSGALVAHRYTYMPPRCRTSQYCRTFISRSVERSCWPCIWWCGTSGFMLHPILSSTIFPFLFFLSIGCYCGAWIFGLIMCRSHSPCLALPASFDDNNKNNDYLIY